MEALRTCVSCGLKAYTEKDLEAFRKNKKLKYGRANWCYDCYNNVYRGDRKKDWDLKATYGITLDDFRKMEEEQEHKCAICKTSTPGGRGSWHVDHCHENGHVRGLLCHSCNTSLGHFKDDIKILENAIKYLKERGSYGIS